MKHLSSTRLICTISFILSFLITNTSISAPAENPPAIAVASAHPLASQAGIDIMEQGGNAFDAAIAITSVLSVVKPASTGLATGGFFLLHDAKNNQDIFIDARERAPLTATDDMYLDAQGEVIAHASLDGPLSAAIPGVPAAIVYLAENYGLLTLEHSFAPAIKIARAGFPVDRIYQQLISMPSILDLMRQYPSSADIFLGENGAVPEIGDKIVQNDLANTLEKIAKQGHKGFYSGEVAEKLVKSVQENGGIWTLADLKDYQLKIGEPLRGRYKDIDVVTAPLPSTGWINILTMLHILGPYLSISEDDVIAKHQIIEAMRLSFWDRAQYLNVADTNDIDVNALISMENADKLRAYIKADRATPSDSLPPVNYEQAKQGNTTHFSIIDEQGNMVSATTTINYIFGSKFVAEGTGLLLNDGMDDFATKPGAANIYGLVGSEANQIGPGKRPISSMAPTFLYTKDKTAILGTPGGSRIPTMILLSILDFAQGKPPIYWVSAGRYHNQYLPDVVDYEPGTFSDDEISILTEFGYQLNLVDAEYYGDMQAILWDKPQNIIFAASDPRGISEAIVQALPLPIEAEPHPSKEAIPVQPTS